MIHRDKKRDRPQGRFSFKLYLFNSVFNFC